MNEFFMQLALDEAWKYQFLTYPNPAVGCVILDKNKQILSIKAHEKAGCEHAELNAIKTALQNLNPKLIIPNEPNLAHEFICKNHNNLLKDALAFVTLEPCNHQGKTPPCARLFAKLKFKKVFIGTKDENDLASGGALFLKQNGVKVQMGILENKAKELIKPFLKWQNGTFKLFKLALSMNGSMLGKIVSNELSRTYAHKIRSVIDILAIGGQTIRKDRPILDSRLCSSKAPNLCIFSKQNLDSFDKEIPLFKVKERKIYTQLPKNTKFIMYEGGENFFKTFKDEMDMFLIFQSSILNTSKSLCVNAKFKPLYKSTFNDDNYGIYELLND
ncbi:bifunctional diaminohydroxyphosphoribosylaminopyrimidine deaminase/5-amino-6-(5-phosphoribosylamino)uracil reductase RibD [Campylobacter sp. LR264d]|nr:MULTISPECIES: bifunctional diaminohydroxyphosphoribosylaminopyrimidine deaminase/5-amino-6-(5-phosphoribosylamino)uracil reductase RibD [unclassified Campylobacter]KAA6225142.1 bifunctional diaminohydroxyphosphoribosylaminopyrimidine deaminase/5-amino-6-(5-phosphoribosylamino)uracil reductase RibD [Campylobacter sp. LR196d]KAA6226156.1 bifunctional diaminohydroxyphosphoribosylaminopyrimidine deaminase/5-amino-6-(5-phosphoribosylamino)uracil reductase RibD [Campylobacter sp. LR185c]KAA6228104.